jgi:integrase
MPTTFPFTAATLSGLTKPAEKAFREVYDAKATGLSCRIGAKTKTFYFEYRVGNRKKRSPIGRFPATSIPEAREECARLSGAVRKGADPQHERKAAAAAPTVLERAEAYLTAMAKKLKPGTLDQSRRNLIKYAAPLHRRPLAQLRRADIAALHDALTRDAGPIQANRVRATISAFLTWAEYRGEVESNVANRVPDNTEASRERVLSDDELRAVWTATAGAGSYHRIVRLALLTGCRRGELGGMRWSELDLDAALWTIPSERIKGKVAHEVPLSALALAQLPLQRPGLDSVFGEADASFQGWSRCKDRLDARLDESMAPWGLHDLRRTLSTRLHEAGVMPHVVEAILAHSDGHKAGVAGVYNRATYRQQKREALELWAQLVAAIVGVTMEAVVPLCRP